MLGQFGNHKLIVGIDLNDRYMQISYWTNKQDNVETISSVAGEENFNIPVVLCKRKGVNQWFYGREAIDYAEENDNIKVTNLLSLALDGETVRIDDEDFSPVALLALFFKRSLSALNHIAVSDKIDGLMVTCETMDSHKKEVLSQVMEIIHLKADMIVYQGYTESFYNYMLSQQKELWFAKVCLFEYRDNQMAVYTMECNRRTKPMVAYVTEEIEDFLPYDPMPEDEALRQERYKRLDTQLYELFQEKLYNQSVTSAYLIGEHFDREWMNESLRFLCRGRRVFQGNNLYSKGACLSMMYRLDKDRENKDYVFLKADKLKCNIGLEVLRRGEPSYIALLDAGMSWYEAQKEVEFYIQDKNELGIVVQSLVGKGTVKVIVPLPDLKGTLSRLRLKVSLKDENHLKIEVSDLGLGEFRVSEGATWEEEIAL